MTTSTDMAQGTILLEASAGTGKTYSITELVLRFIVEQGLSIDQLLVVTFTNAATAELRDRIRRRLYEALTELRQAPAPDMQALRRLSAALQGFDQAAIMTIHGFCQSMLELHAFESGTDFAATLETDQQPLQTQAVEDFWVDRLYGAPMILAQHYHGNETLYQELLDLAKRVADDPDLPIEPAAPAVTDWPAVEDGLRRAWRLAQQAWQSGRAAAVTQLLDLAAKDWLKKKHHPTSPEIAEGWAAVLDRYFETFVPGALPPLLDTFALTDLKKAGQGNVAPTPVTEAFADLLAAADDVQALLAEHVIAFKQDLAAYVRDVLPARKLDLRQLSFADLLSRLRAALTAPSGDDLAKAIRQRFKAALIDEFQDTDPVQWAIFERLFHGSDHWLYLIGDPKQAIYAFRGADIHTYLEAKTKATDKRHLATNYRSDQLLVSAMNRLFAVDRCPEAFLTPGIDYHEVSAHHQSERLRLGDGRAPLMLRFCKRDLAKLTKQGYGITAAWAESRLATQTAADISTLLAEKPLLVEKGRALCPGDVAVLVRSNRQAERVQEALNRLGIPNVRQGDDSVFDSAEAESLAQLLAAVLDPARPALVKTALATEWCGRQADALLALNDDDEAWWQWIDRLSRWGQTWETAGFMPMFRQLIDDLALSERLLGWDDGERRLTNLLHLAELVHTAATSDGHRPATLLAWLRQQRGSEEQTQEQAKIRLEKDDQAVTIITVHKSKGLQYPVVFCPYLWKTGKGRPSDKANLIYHDAAGRRRIDVRPDKPKDDPNLLSAEADQQAEAMRLLYVALTRAEHHCVVYWGWFASAAKSPIGFLLHAPIDGTLAERSAKLAESFAGKSDETLLAELEALRLGHEPLINVSPVDLGLTPGRRFRVTGEAGPADLTARAWERSAPLDAWWRIGSFTGLTRNHAAVTLEAHDDEDGIDAPEEAPTATGRTILLTNKLLPSNTTVGIALHALYERWDFTSTDQDALAEVVGKILLQSGLSKPQLIEPVAAGIAGTLQVPLLADGLRLADLTAKYRLNELAFDLPVAGGWASMGQMTVQQLAEVFADHQSEAVSADYPIHLQGLRFAPLRGFLTGSIDLVFRHDGKWYLADYKSNYLGDEARDYGPEQLRGAMSHGHYYLQYHLYTVALHRYLQLRLSGYDYATHFGGVLYLFVRGMGPDYGPGSGVFTDRPSVAMVEALAALLSGERGARA